MYAIKALMLSTVLGLTVSIGACVNAESGTSEAAAATKVVAQRGTVSNISNAQLQDLLVKGVALVDIRLPEEWAETGVVEGSHRLTLFEKNGAVAANFLANLQKIVPADQPVALICRTGNRTRAGADMLAQAGYSQVYNVTRGITGWIGEGRPTVKN